MKEDEEFLRQVKEMASVTEKIHKIGVRRQNMHPGLGL